MSQAAVSTWLKGRVPSGITLVRLAQFFGVSAEEMLGMKDQAKTGVGPATSGKGERKSNDEIELNFLLDQLKTRIQRDLGACRSPEAKERLRMIARLFGLKNSSRRKSP